MAMLRAVVVALIAGIGQDAVPPGPVILPSAAAAAALHELTADGRLDDADVAALRAQGWSEELIERVRAKHEAVTKRGGVVFDGKHLATLQAAMADGVIDDREVERLRAEGAPEHAIEGLEKMLRSRVHKPRVTHLSLPLREPITHREIDYAKQILVLSEAQAAHLDRLYAEYVEAAPPFWRDRTAALYERSALAAASPNASLERAEHYAAALDDCDRVERALAARDNAFFDLLLPILGEQQQTALQRVRDLRTRIACAPDKSLHPGADADLLRWHLDLSRAHPDDRAPTQPLFDEIMLGYEAELTNLTVRLRGQATRAEAKRSFNLAAGGLAFLAQQHAANAPAVHTAAMIHDLNVGTIERLRFALPAEGAERLHAMFREGGYRAVYPHDDRAVAFLLAHARRAPSDQQPRLLELHQEAVRQVAAINAEMVQRLVKWRREVAEIGGFSHAPYREYQGEMTGLLKRRNAALASALDGAVLILPEQETAIKQLRDALNRELASRSDPNGGASGLGWPHPYDNFGRQR